MKIHQWFIPTKANKFHPVALRSSGLIVFLLIFISIPLLYNIVVARQFQVLGYAIDVNVNDLYSISNQERTNNGLAPLTMSTQLNNAAAAKAQDMITDNYWAHVAPDGTTPWTFILNSGYSYSAAGENLAKGFNTSSGVVDGWMESSAHRDNILNSTYNDVGYAVINGVLLGDETTLVVAMYGAQVEPVSIVATSSPTQNSSAPTATTTNNTQPSETATPTITNTSNTAEINVESVTEESPILAGISNTATIKDSNGLVEGLETSIPVQTYKSLNWGQKASVMLICVLILLFIMKHTLIWREQKRGFRHIWLRSHPLGQAAVLTVVLIITIFSGVGVVL